MSISITITNPEQLTNAEREVLRLFLGFGGPASVAASAPAVPIAPHDSPDAGLDQPNANQAFNAESGNPAAAFTQTEPTAAQAFATATDPNANPPGAAVSTPSAFVPAPASTQLAAPVAPVPSAAGAGVDVDKNGLPWDAQIHAETKSKNKDGSWRNKRGVAPEVIAAREQQLRAVMGAPAAPLAVAASPVAPVPVAPIVAPPPAHVPAAPDLGNVPSPVASPSVAAAATPQNVGSVSPSNFVEFIGKVAPMIQSGKLTQDEVKAACLAHGVPDLALVSARPDLIPAINASIDATLATKG